MSSWWLRTIWASLATWLIAVGALVPHLSSSTEVVRLRNALLLASAEPIGFDWSPDSLPNDFIRESGPVDPFFTDAVMKLRLTQSPSDWSRILTISEHLLSHPQLVGTPIQSDLRGTYDKILNDGSGYCGDFTRVFMALVMAAGMQVRAWSFSFDGFGGHGHIWPEVWNRQLGQWQLVDVFNNYYFVGAEGIPLSALALRRAMQQQPKTLRLMALSPSGRQGYEVQSKAWDYYHRGLAQWYLSWGNNVYSYDQAFLVRSLGPWSRALEQLGAIAQGVYPPIHVLADAQNAPHVTALFRLKRKILVVAGLLIVGLLAILISVIGLQFSTRHSARGSEA